jgi:hypothetical protein
VSGASCPALVPALIFSLSLSLSVFAERSLQELSGPIVSLRLLSRLVQLLPQNLSLVRVPLRLSHSPASCLPPLQTYRQHVRKILLRAIKIPGLAVESGVLAELVALLASADRAVAGLIVDLLSFGTDQIEIVQLLVTSGTLRQLSIAHQVMPLTCLTLCHPLTSPASASQAHSLNSPRLAQLLSDLYCRLSSPSLDEVMSTVPCLLHLIHEPKCWTATCTALGRLTELGDEITDRLVEEGSLSLIFAAILERPNAPQEPISDFLSHLLLARPETLQAILSAGYLKVLLATGHLAQSVEEALDRSPTEVLDKLLELSLVRDLIALDHPDCYGAIAACTGHALDTGHLNSLVEQGVLTFLSRCLQRSVHVNKTLRLFRYLLRLEPQLARQVQGEAGEEIGRWRLGQSQSQSGFETAPLLAEEVWYQLESS